MDIIAHRGSSYTAPENTLGAFRLAWKEDADGIEGDFRLTRDGRVVCLHDEGTGRMSGVDRRAADSTLAELRQVDVGLAFSFRWMGQRVPTLEEVLETVPAGRKVYIELKSGPAAVAPIAAILAGTPSIAPEQVSILSFDAAVVAQSVRALPGVRALWLTDHTAAPGAAAAPDAEAVCATLAACAAAGVGCAAHPRVDAAYVQRLVRAGREVHVWTVDDPLEASRYRHLGVASLTTNRPGWLRRELEQAWSR